MKKLFLILCTVSFYTIANAQAYIPLRLEDDVHEATRNKTESKEYNTNRSYVGIVVNYITPQGSGSYAVELYNANYNDEDCYTSYAFDWYLSYKGKRVSDYYSSTIRCRDTEQRIVRCWPDEVPRGYESYVTVQFGREKAPKDRRDDF